MAADLPTAAAVTSGTVTNAQQKINFAAMLNFILGYLGAKFGIGPQTVASAATLNLEAVTDTRDLVISGVVAITAVTVEAGKVFRCRASGAFTLTNNASIVTQTAANIVCASGDTFIMRATATNTVEILFFTRAAPAVLTTGAQTIAGVKTFSSMPVLPLQSMVRVNGSSGAGSTNTAIRRFTTTVTTQGTDITFTQSPVNGDSWTTNVNGVYGISYTDSFNTGSDFGLSLNSNQLTTGFNSITAANKLAAGQTTGANVANTCSTTIYLPAGSVIRAHFDPTNSAGSRTPLFTITRIS